MITLIDGSTLQVPIVVPGVYGRTEARSQVSGDINDLDGVGIVCIAADGEAGSIYQFFDEGQVINMLGSDVLALDGSAVHAHRLARLVLRVLPTVYVAVVKVPGAGDSATLDDYKSAIFKLRQVTGVRHIIVDDDTAIPALKQYLDSHFKGVSAEVMAANGGPTLWKTANTDVVPYTEVVRNGAGVVCTRKAAPALATEYSFDYAAGDATFGADPGAGVTIDYVYPETGEYLDFNRQSGYCGTSAQKSFADGQAAAKTVNDKRMTYCPQRPLDKSGNALTGAYGAACAAVLRASRRNPETRERDRTLGINGWRVDVFAEFTGVEDFLNQTHDLQYNEWESLINSGCMALEGIGNTVEIKRHVTTYTSYLVGGVDTPDLTWQEPSIVQFDDWDLMDARSEITAKYMKGPQSVAANEFTRLAILTYFVARNKVHSEKGWIFLYNPLNPDDVAPKPTVAFHVADPSISGDVSDPARFDVRRKRWAVHPLIAIEITTELVV
jgi:hypothetical protein